MRGRRFNLQLPDPQTKSLVETRVAASALINAGADLITDAGLYAASTAAARSSAGLDLWAAQSGANMRLHTGSYVDAKSYALNVGFAKRQKTAEGTLFFGPFVEYGRGSYDSYLDDGTRGNGAMHYIGAGIMGKLYAGLAWEFEFGGKACASFDGMSTLSPSL